MDVGRETMHLPATASDMIDRAEVLARLRVPLVVHITAGALGLISGYVALYAAKGGTVHRKGGMVFVYAMVTMAVFGAVIALAEAERATLIAACLAAYLVITGLSTLRPATVQSWRFDAGALLVGFAIAVASLAFARGALMNPTSSGSPDAVGLGVFGAVALLASIGDVRRLRSRGSRGIPRLRRHLWRMSFGLFIAAFSFFLGQAQVFPSFMRIPALLALPVLLVLGTMVYWLWRVRRRLASGTIHVSSLMVT